MISLRKFFKILTRTILILLVLLLVSYILLHFSPVQTWVARKAAAHFSEKLNTKVSIKKVDFKFFNKLSFEGLMVEDRKHDTLLYAGAANVRLTDWFFFKDKITLHYIGLDDAVVNMKRTDAEWNYQFLIDYFGDTTASTGNKSAIELNIEKIESNNIRFNKIDQWVGQDMIVSVNKMDVAIDKVDLANNIISITDITLDKPNFSQSNYTGKRPDDYVSPPAKTTSDPTETGNKNPPKPFTVSLSRLRITDGEFENEKETERAVYADRFDGQHILFSAINAEFKNMKLIGDSLTGNIQIATKERSGLEVKKLAADIVFTPTQMEFSNLDLRTNKSRLTNYYAMRFESFNRDMNSFLSNVKIEGRFNDSEVYSDDLALFAPGLKTWNRVFYLNGDAKGTVDNFTAEKLNIQSGQTLVTGKLVMRGLPDINSTFIDYTSNGLQTNYDDLVAFVPSLKKVNQPNLRALGNIFYKGNFTGFLNDFVAYGMIKTNLGTMTADLNMKLPDNAEPRYSGKIITDNFDLGAFTNSKDVGMVSMNGNLKGTGFTFKELKAGFDGNISLLQVKGYTYRNIFARGDFADSRFKGNLTIDDPNLQLKNLDGTLTLSGKEISFDLAADLTNANLQKLGFSKENLQLGGRFHLNFTGDNIDNFLGSARVYGATLKRDSIRLSFDSLTLVSTMLDDKKYLSLQSNEIDAVVTGKFKILELPDAFKSFLSNYYPAYIKPPTRKLDKQDFSFDIKTKDIEQYIQLFDKRLSGFNNAAINGKLDLANSELYINADVPEFGYDGKKFTNTKLSGTGNSDTLRANVTVDDIAMSDSLHFPETKLVLSASNDVSDVQLTTSAGKTLNKAELNARVHTLQDGVKLHFFPSEFIVNDKRWQLEKDGELSIRKDYIDASEITFNHGDQRIVLSSEFDDLTSKTHVVARLTKVNLGDFMPLVFKKPAIKGILTGVGKIKDPFGKPVLEFEGNADSLAVDDELVGKTKLKGSANFTTGKVNYEAITADSTNDFSIKGTYNYKDSVKGLLDVSIAGEKVSLGLIEPYLKTVFSDMEGVATSNLRITGTGSKKSVIGKTTIKEGSVKVAYTQCRYLIRNQTVNFEDGVINLGYFQLRDTLSNTATLSGRIYHEFFDKLFFDNVKLETEKLALLHTTKYDNSQFYGNVIGRANMNISGPTTDLRMNIFGSPSILDSSHIYLPTGAGKESNTVDYIDFIQFGSEMEEAKLSQNSNIIVDLTVDANPACQVDVILDEETQDIIKGQGSGRINIRVGNREALTIRGDYVLSKGQYTFNFQTFLKKPFELNRGVIGWRGDPYQADINIDAEYLAKNVDISSLSSGRGFLKEDVKIIAHLVGKLQQPKINFEFQLPDGAPAKSDDITVKRLADFKNDENEMNKQVASLLLFNTFIVGNQNFLSQGSGGSLFTSITSTIGGIISDLLTGFLNRELQKATNNVLSTYIDINPTLDLQKSAAQLQANVRAGLKILLSNRLVVLVGGNLDYNNPTYATQLDRKGLLTPDISIEWMINKDGTLRVVGFNRSSIDFTLNQRNRSGVQLSYRKDINRFSDIFRSRKKIEAAERAGTPTEVRMVNE